MTPPTNSLSNDDVLYANSSLTILGRLPSYAGAAILQAPHKRVGARIAHAFQALPAWLAQ
jgi:hypothetical protein